MDSWLTAQEVELQRQLRATLNDIQSTDCNANPTAVRAKMQTWSAFFNNNKAALIGGGVGASAALGFGTWEVCRAASAEVGKEMVKSGWSAVFTIGGAVVQAGVAATMLYISIRDQQQILKDLPEYRSQLEALRSRHHVISNELKDFIAKFIPLMGTGRALDDVDLRDGILLAAVKLSDMQSRVEGILSSLHTLTQNVTRQHSSAQANHVASTTTCITSYIGGSSALITAAVISCPVTAVAAGITLGASVACAAASGISAENMRKLDKISSEIQTLIREVSSTRTTISNLHAVAQTFAEEHSKAKSKKRADIDASIHEMNEAQQRRIESLLRTYGGKK